MFSSQIGKSYTINLPASTSKDILEWFEIMDASNRLSDEVIHLVNNSIKTENPFVNSSMQSEDDSRRSFKHLENTIDQDDFFNSLYNWQDANNQVFVETEPKLEKKVKKKMLSV